uniref:Uncharacterized protein n=1 Tax=Papio anubis TaxID=9555 RepID=A0A8I5NXX4_PAPAN
MQFQCSTARETTEKSKALPWAGRFRGSSDSHASTTRVAGITGVHHHTWLIFVFLVEMGFRHVTWSGLKLLVSRDLPTSASQSAGITGVNHHARPNQFV